MKCKSFRLILFVSFLFVFNNSAIANIFISVGFPNQYILDSRVININNSNIDLNKARLPNGQSFHLNYNFLFGFGYDNVVQEYTYNSHNNNLLASTNIYNYFVVAPIPLVKLEAGLGSGSTTFKTDSDVTDADILQYFVKIGLPIFKFGGIHVGYHKFVGSEVKLSETTLIDPNASMLSTSVSISF